MRFKNLEVKTVIVQDYGLKYAWRRDILDVSDPHCLELPAVSVLHRIEFFRFLKEQRLCKMHIV